jgi:signal transduction histidine kinase
MVSPFAVVGATVVTLAGLLYCVSAVSTYRIGEPGTSSLAVAMTLLGLGAVGGIVARFQPWVQTSSDIWLAVFLPGAFLAVLPWVVFVLHYTGNGRLVTVPRVVGAAVVPLLSSAAIVYQQLFPDAGVAQPGSLAWVAIVSASLLLFTLLLGGSLLQLYASYSYDSVRFRSGFALWLAGGAPLLSFQFYSITPNGLVVGSGLLVGALASLVGVTVYDAFDTTPAAGRFGRRRLADEIEDPVAFLDADGDVIETNDAFESQFAVDETAATGNPLPAVVGSTLSELVNAESVELITDEGRRQFAPRVTDLTDHHDRVRGTIVVLPDITDQKLREQRLAVLNRVVRHNLRNELSVVRGFAQEIGSEGVSDDLAADRIVEASDNLITLGERAREAAQLLDHEPEAREVDLGEFVSEIAGDLYEEAANLTVETDVPTDATVETDPDLLYRSISHLAQNAVIHNDADDPEVEISVTTDRDGRYPVEVVVADNGPGIPGHEWRAIEEGKETPLEHGSGLGLWAVRWAVTRLGGEIFYEPNEPRGSVVRVRFSTGEEREPDVAAEPAGTAVAERA